MGLVGGIGVEETVVHLSWKEIVDDFVGLVGSLDNLLVPTRNEGIVDKENKGRASKQRQSNPSITQQLFSSTPIHRTIATSIATISRYYLFYRNKRRFSVKRKTATIGLCQFFDSLRLLFIVCRCHAALGPTSLSCKILVRCCSPKLFIWFADLWTAFSCVAINNT